MATPVLQSVSEYLATSYSPDREYVDGEILERALGESDHSSVQAALVARFYSLRDRHGIRVYPEQRVRVKPTRFRVPDVTITLGRIRDPILHEPPLAVVEILSREDTMHSLGQRIDDYLDFGIGHIWVVDPAGRRAYLCTRSGYEAVNALRMEDPAIEIPLAEILSDLD